MADRPADETPDADTEPEAETVAEQAPRTPSPHWSPPTKNIMAVALAIASLVVVYLSRNVLAVAALAGLIAFLVAPVIRFLHVRAHLPRILALLMSYVSVFVGMLVIGFLMVDGVVGAASELDVSEAEASLRSTATDLLENVREFSIAGYTDDLTDAVDPLLEDLRNDSSDSSSSSDDSDSSSSSDGDSEKRLQLSSDQIQSLFGGITSSVSTVGSTLLAAFMSGVVTVLVAIYLNADSTKFGNGFRRLVPAGHRGDIERLGDRTLRIWRGYVYGQLLNSLIVGVLMWVVLWLIGLPGAFVFALTLGLLNMIPTFGPILAAIPAVLAALALGSTRLDWGNLGFAVLVTVLYLVVVQLQANLVAPFITGRAVRLSPATVIIGLLVGVQVGGLVGALLVVPVIATGKEYGRYVIAKLTDSDPFADRGDEPEGPRPTDPQPTGSRSSGSQPMPARGGDDQA